MRRLAKVKFEGRKKLDYRVDEAYKSLRTNVQFSGSGVQVIDFTSCTPNEGKSSVAFNLAVSFAESGKRVIMIDADMRKSVLAGRLRSEVWMPDLLIIYPDKRRLMKYV